MHYIAGIFQKDLFSMPYFRPWLLIAAVLLFFAVEWIGREEKHALAKLAIKWPQALRWSLYIALTAAIFYSARSEQQFIYFQF
jgi:hypothetical protein